VSLAEWFGFMGGALGIAQGIPQVVRLRRLGHGLGVSWASRLMMVSSSAAWMAYGIREGSPAMIVTNLISLLIEAYVVVLLAGLAPSAIANMAVIIGASLAVPLLLPLVVVSVVMFGFTLSRAPQIVRSYRTRRDGLQQSAVSMGSLVTSVVSLLCWTVFSVLSQRPLLVGTTTLAMSTTLAVAYLERTTPRSAAAARAALVGASSD
jgi:uncharacterized protein with PQ loop repeat